MDKSKLKSGMLLRISAGTGTYKDRKWAAIIRVISVNRYDNEIKGMQYITIAQRGENHDPDFLRYTLSNKILLITKKFDDWWETFKPKLLV